MRVTSKRKGGTVKTVTITDITAEPEDEIVDFACKVSGETRVSLFGSHVRWIDASTVIVSLYTD